MYVILNRKLLYFYRNISLLSCVFDIVVQCVEKSSKKPKLRWSWNNVSSRIITRPMTIFLTEIKLLHQQPTSEVSSLHGSIEPFKGITVSNKNNRDMHFILQYELGGGGTVRASSENYKVITGCIVHILGVAVVVQCLVWCRSGTIDRFSYCDVQKSVPAIHCVLWKL